MPTIIQLALDCMQLEVPTIMAGWFVRVI